MASTTNIQNDFFIPVIFNEDKETNYLCKLIKHGENSTVLYRIQNDSALIVPTI